MHVRTTTAAVLPSAAVLVTIAFLNNVDRTVMSGLLQSVKESFQLTDAAVGALSGVSFALAYTSLGLPFARIADVVNRKRILVLALASWSTLTLLCGLAPTVGSFFVARLGVAICEAAGTPALHSLFAELYSAQLRTRAAGLIVTGTTLGSIVGVSSGGIIAQHYGWRAAFVSAGLPGLLLTPLAIWWLHEPRLQSGRLSAAQVLGSGLGRACHDLARKRSFRHFLLGSVLFGFWLWGTGTWFTTFLVRSYHLSMSAAAFSYGLLSGSSTVLGTLFSAALADRLVRRNRTWLCWLPAVATLLCALFALSTYLVDSAAASLTLYVIANVFTGIVWSTQYAATYAYAGRSNRALGVAALNFFSYLIGLGVAPLVIGLMSDQLVTTYATDSLRRSLLLATLALPLASLAYWRSAARFNLELAPD